jgi:solute carrier family 25 phosphate transporter 23/24/25/41
LDASGDVSLNEFINYVKNHEKKLKLVFMDIDRNQDGRLDAQELTDAFRKLGVNLGPEEAQTMIQRLGEDGGRVEISWEEWRDYLLLSPSTDLTDLVQFWRHGYLDETVVPDDFSAQEMKAGVWMRHLIAGGVAGAVSRTSTAPLDRIKVFLQVHGRSCPATSSGIVGCVRSMVLEGGVLSMWRGNGINILKIAPESALKFMAYEQGKRFIKGKSNRELKIEERFVAGSLAGAFSQSVIYPLEVMKTRLALRKTGEYKSIADLTLKMYKSEGFRVFYKGYIPNLLGILPYAGIDLAVYETLKKFYLRRQDRATREPPIILLLSCGTISSACGQLASYPLALVRTRLQATSGYDNSMVGLFKAILENEGVFGLYRGLMPNFLKVAPAVSISYVVYERVRGAMGVEMT